jgi:periplasmic protein TonB
MKKYLILLIFAFVSISLKAQTTRKDSATKTGADTTKEIWIPVDVEPVPKNGIEGVFMFIEKNFKKPKDSQEFQGRVIVQFIVEKDGSLTNIKVMRGLTSAIDKEVIRVIGLLPKWNPGMAGGQPARVQYTFPVRVN